MSEQELKFSQEFQEEDSICRSMYHLSTAASHRHGHRHRHRHHHPNTAAATSGAPDAYTTTAYVNSSKRQSPLSPSSFQEPVSKKASLHYPSSPSTAAAEDVTAVADECDLFGFTRLPFPHPFPAVASSPPLRRTVSEPIHTADDINPSAPPAQSEFPFQSDPFSNPPQENPNPNNVLQDSLPLPNAPPVVHRTVSDPSPLANHQVVAAGGTPPYSRRPPLARNNQRSPSCAESPSTKRLRRMKERLKEMSQWWNQVVHEDEEDDDESENDFTENIQKEGPENDEVENPSQEAVWVEKKGECLVLHFKCPCGTVYQILLSGNNCYYKLTHF
ncbi:hypothetical protein STAS_18418 [Striga asiatica]|uniref:Uncharacterized protein n=1 Tax=Striga asiatica TaxID=4170 RepID=A0A5A7Q8V4_STRAF|nr:hypothetical protein STAS_18418 [Striga asiatica]